MNNNPQMNKARLDMLLSMAGKKLGTDPSKLKSQLEQGAFDEALKASTKTSRSDQPSALQPAGAGAAAEHPPGQTAAQ